MMFECEPCRGRGWILTGTNRVEWPTPCPSCTGYGRLTIKNLAHLIQEDPFTLRRLLEMRRTRFSCAERIFGKLVARWPNA
jgi:hypothetical protein